jgi:XTP/dITP diphosphohydrolase
MHILVATSNEGKLREYTRLLHVVPALTLCTMASLERSITVDEDQDSFEGNALKKAREIAALARMPCLADDSGLEVDALDGRPGVYSARYCGEGATDAANNEKLLAELRDVPDALRTARFRCVIAVVDPDGRMLAVADGVCEGRISRVPRGATGFGYDPVFVPEGHSRTMAELGLVTKNQISHRARAAEKLVPMLRALSEREHTEADE